MRARRIWAGVVVAGAVTIGVGPAVAAGIAVPGDDSGTVAVDGKRSDDGDLTATLDVTNTSDADEPVQVGTAAPGCSVEVAPTTAFAQRTTTVTLTATCSEDAATDLDLRFTVGDVDVAVVLEVAEPPDWGWLLVVVVAALVVSAVVVGLVVGATISGLKQQKVSEGRPQWQGGVTAPRPRAPVTEPVTWRSVLSGAPTDWSFSDSWASTFAAGLALLTALFGSTGVLEALVGDAPPGAEGKLLVLAAVSGLAVGLAPLLLAFFGTATATNVVGLASAAVLTLTGTLVQLGGIPAVLAGTGLMGPTVVLSGLLGVLLVGYAIVSLRRLLATSFDPQPEPTPVAGEALVGAVALLLNPEGGAAVVDSLRDAAAAANAYLRDPVGDVEQTGQDPPPPTWYPPPGWGTAPGDGRRRTALL